MTSFTDDLSYQVIFNFWYVYSEIRTWWAIEDVKIEHIPQASKNFKARKMHQKVSKNVHFGKLIQDEEENVLTSERKIELPLSFVFFFCLWFAENKNRSLIQSPSCCLKSKIFIARISLWSLFMQAKRTEATNEYLLIEKVASLTPVKKG